MGACLPCRFTTIGQSLVKFNYARQVTGYNKTGYSISHTMLGRQVTYNSILFISFDYYMQ